MKKATEKMTKSSRAILCVLALPPLTACTVTIPAISPSPNVALVQQQRSIDIAFGPGVEDAFKIFAGNRTVDVRSWHQTLRNGFRNAFGGAFLAPRGPKPDLTLRIDQARLEIGRFDAAQARIQYAVTLTGADGTLRRSAGIGSRAAPTFSGATALVSDILIGHVSASIAAMYEQLAKELFADTQPAPAAKGCVPGRSTGCFGPKGCKGFQVCSNDGSRFSSCACD
jgi:hypothetical protein